MSNKIIIPFNKLYYNNLLFWIHHNFSFVICFITILLFAWWSNPHLKGYTDIDTQSYIMVANIFLIIQRKIDRLDTLFY